MDSSLEASVSAAIAAAKQRLKQGEKLLKELLKELQKFRPDLGFGEPSDPFASVREPKKRGPTGGHLAVAVTEPEPETRVDAVTQR